MKVELSRFRVKRGKSARVDEWMDMLNANRDDLLHILSREQMKFEVIFREIIDDDEYLYWFSVQGEGGEPVKSSPHAIDQKHLEFHDECVDPDYGMRDAQVQLVLAPREVTDAMNWIPSAEAITFQRREFIYRPKSD